MNAANDDDPIKAEDYGCDSGCLIIVLLVVIVTALVGAALA